MSDEKIIVDLNRITRRQFHDHIQRLKDAEEAGDVITQDEINGGFAERVVASWPYKNDVTMDGYLDLPFVESVAVDRAIGAAMEELREKK